MNNIQFKEKKKLLAIISHTPPRLFQIYFCLLLNVPVTTLGRFFNREEVEEARNNAKLLNTEEIVEILNDIIFDNEYVSPTQCDIIEIQHDKSLDETTPKDAKPHDNLVLFT